MTLTELHQCLPQLREIFPKPIVQEWSIAEYLAGMKALDKRLPAALDRWKEGNENRLNQNSAQEAVQSSSQLEKENAAWIKINNNWSIDITRWR